MNSRLIISGIFIKQMKDVTKNIQVLFLYFIFPVIGFVMSTAIPKEAGAGDASFFLSIFASIHCIFTPIVTTSSIIAEEKEKNTLRVLIMSNVKPFQYLISIGGFVFLSTLLTGSSFIVMSGYAGNEAMILLLFMCIGTICSTILGMAIGAYAKNMMSANGLAVPFGMLFGFLPMLASFNESIMKFGRYTYGVQISKVFALVESFEWNIELVLVIGINFLIFLTMFVMVFRKNNLEE